jgi:tetratricopeptide (TPR) repeat protein
MADPLPQPGSPSPYEIANVLQDSLLKRANVKIKAGRIDEAEQLYREVEAVNQKIVDEIRAGAEWYKTLPESKQPLIKSHFEQSVDLGKTGQANILCRKGKGDQAKPIYDQVIEARRENCRANPEDPNARDQLALQLRNYGQYMLRVGKTDDAIRLLGQAHDFTEQNVTYDPKNAGYRRAHGFSLYYWGVANAEGDRNENALALFERSRVLRQEMHDATPDQSNKVNLMLSEARLGNASATSTLIEELNKSQAKDPDLRLDLARALAQLSKQEADAGKKEELRTRAFAALEQALADGLQDPFAIRSEVDLKPLRDDERFEKLAQSLNSSMN